MEVVGPVPREPGRDGHCIALLRAGTGLLLPGPHPLLPGQHSEGESRWGDGALAWHATVLILKRKVSGWRGAQQLRVLL